MRDEKNKECTKKSTYLRTTDKNMRSIFCKIDKKENNNGVWMK